MTEQALTAETILNQIKLKAKEIPDEVVFYCISKLRKRPFKPIATKVMKYCLAIQLTGLPISSSLLSSLVNLGPCAMLEHLHKLGDYRCLAIVRQTLDHKGVFGGLPIFYAISSEFWDIYNEIIAKGKQRWLK